MIGTFLMLLGAIVSTWCMAAGHMTASATFAAVMVIAATAEVTLAAVEVFKR